MTRRSIVSNAGTASLPVRRMKRWKRETHSPRGRINLVKMVAEGKAEIDDLREPIEKCLGCMACTTVCPTNVQYGKILESAQDVIEDSTEKRYSGRLVEDFLFNDFFPSARWMDLLGNGTWLFQKSGLDQRINDWDWLPLHLNEFAAVLPRIPSPKERKSRATCYVRTRPATAKVGFFTGCVMDSVFFESNQNTIELLLRSGAEVVLPESQTCCGALHGHAGKAEKSVELAKENIRAFETESFDYIVNNAGGCGAKLIEYPHLFEEGSKWRERAISFSEHVVDISQVLVDLDQLTFTKPLEETVTYQPSCHMQHVQKVVEPPLTMLEKIPGLRLEELERPDFCCGSAGIYNIVNYEDSMKILDVKMDDVSRTDAESVVTCNPGCLLQMKLGIKREGMESKMDAVHLVDLLMRAEPRMKSFIS